MGLEVAQKRPFNCRFSDSYLHVGRPARDVDGKLNSSVRRLRLDLKQRADFSGWTFLQAL